MFLVFCNSNFEMADCIGVLQLFATKKTDKKYNERGEMRTKAKHAGGESQDFVARK